MRKSLALLSERSWARIHRGFASPHCHIGSTLIGVLVALVTGSQDVRNLHVCERHACLASTVAIDFRPLRPPCHARAGVSRPEAVSRSQPCGNGPVSATIASASFVSLSFALVRSAPVRSAPVRSAPVRSALARFAAAQLRLAETRAG